MSDAANSQTKATKTIGNSGESGMIKADQTIAGHAGTPKTSEPNTVIDRIGKDGSVNVRSFYGVDGMKFKDIHTDDHGNPKQHPYGKHGEHVHDYEWDDDGRLKNKATREITDEEPGRERRYSMTQAEMKQIIQDCCNDVLFTYNQKSSGFTSDVKNYVTTFHAWHGTETKDYSSVNDLMSDPFFGGKSIHELIGEVEFVFT